MSMRVGVDSFNIPQTHAEMIMTNDAAFCTINPSTSTSGIWWLNITCNTAERADEAVVILRQKKYLHVIKWKKK